MTETSRQGLSHCLMRVCAVGGFSLFLEGAAPWSHPPFRWPRALCSQCPCCFLPSSVTAAACSAGQWLSLELCDSWPAVLSVALLLGQEAPAGRGGQAEMEEEAAVP